MRQSDIERKIDLKAQLCSLIEKVSDPTTNETDRIIFREEIANVIEDLILNIVHQDR